MNTYFFVFIEDVSALVCLSIVMLALIIAIIIDFNNKQEIKLLEDNKEIKL